MKIIKSNGMARRINILYLTPSEKKIHEAISEIESLGADVRLTQAQLLLSQALRELADFIDEQIQESD